MTTTPRFPFYACLIRRFPGNNDWIDLVAVSSCSAVFQFNEAERPLKVRGNNLFLFSSRMRCCIVRSTLLLTSNVTLRPQKTVPTNRDEEPWTSTSTFTQLLSSEAVFLCPELYKCTFVRNFCVFCDEVFSTTILSSSDVGKRWVC